MTLSIHGLLGPDEVSIAWQAVAQYRKSQGRKSTVSESATEGTDAATADVAQRIFTGLMLGPLGSRYRQFFEALLDAPEKESVKIEDLEGRLGASIEELRANVSKLSARMKRIATPEEIKALRSPFMLLSNLTYDDRNYARYQLTPAGRIAIKRYLGR